LLVTIMCNVFGNGRSKCFNETIYNRFLKTCTVQAEVTPAIARRAAELRRLARTGSAVDALVVALAEPGGTVLTGDKADIEALAAHARDVSVELV
jgi:hypothetical protein